ncbi:MAG: cysteine synthase A [Candidatus Hydrogenedentota bacterium]
MNNLDNRGKKCGAKIADNILELMFNTPMIKLNRIVKNGSADVYAKLESYSPGGSVKDRIAYSMIEDAEKKGILKPGSVIVEPTSGNTGIGLALIAAHKGYKCILTMPESMSVERRYILSLFGVEIVLTPAQEGMAGALKKANEIVKQNPDAFMPQQFENPSNPQIHRETTALEILSCMGNEKIDAFVAGVGTGGTITGVGEVLKERYPDILIVGVEPSDSAVLSGNQPGSHKIQGIGPGFIPWVLNRKIINKIITVKNEEAIIYARRLAKEESLFCGISSGAACFASLLIAKELGTSKKVVTIFPDTGERYLSMR